MLLYTYKLQNSINITFINTWKFKDHCNLLYCSGLELNLQYLHGMPVLEQSTSRTLTALNVWEIFGRYITNDLLRIAGGTAKWDSLFERQFGVFLQNWNTLTIRSRNHIPEYLLKGNENYAHTKT